MNININRLKKNLIELGKIGYVKTEESPDNLPYGGKGITRIAFTPEYEKANEFVKKKMEKAGLEVYEDPVGNLFGKITGNKCDKSIIIGSHIDTVPCGGMFDGSLGVLSGLEAVQTLIENNYQNKHTLEVAVFIGEEGREIGGTFGSRSFTGELNLSDKEVSFLKKIGIEERDVTKSRVNPDFVKNYLELHVEQGRILETEKISIGIVEGIAGILRYNVIVKGQANHAGTTPMDLRNDALVKACKLIIRLNEIVKNLDSSLVGTVGDIKVEPGAVNVIPGRVEFPIELRGMNKDKVYQIISLLKEEMDENVSVEELSYEKEVYLSEKVQSTIQRACEMVGHNYKYMVSGAGHDANPISKITPTGMIFVPSKKGISHAPDEWTDWEYVEKGADVMLATIKLLDNS